MTDLRAVAIERAEQVIRDVHKELPDVWLGGRQRYVLVEAIADALADAERRGMERAAKIAENAIPRAHTYASENADIYHAQDDAMSIIVKAIRYQSKVKP